MEGPAAGSTAATSGATMTSCQGGICGGCQFPWGKTPAFPGPCWPRAAQAGPRRGCQPGLGPLPCLPGSLTDFWRHPRSTSSWSRSGMVWETQL